MFPGIDRLKMLRVRDVMTREVIELSADQTMCDAAQAFDQSHVSSAPVLDNQGRCVGMLSAADFIKYERPRCSNLDRPDGARYAPDDPSSHERASDLVSQYMSATPRFVAEDELLLHAARVMSADHIHHLPVLKNERPIGVVSTMDIVAALINAVDEVEIQLTPRHA